MGLLDKAAASENDGKKPKAKAIKKAKHMVVMAKVNNEAIDISGLHW